MHADPRDRPDDRRDDLEAGEDTAAEVAAIEEEFGGEEDTDLELEEGLESGDAEE